MPDSSLRAAFVSYVCGWPGYNRTVRLWVEPAAMHSPLTRRGGMVHKPLFGAYGCAQPDPFLYTVYRQFYDTLVSVVPTVVHIIHRAYIYRNKLNKGAF